VFGIALALFVMTVLSASTFNTDSIAAQPISSGQATPASSYSTNTFGFPRNQQQDTLLGLVNSGAGPYLLGLSLLVLASLLLAIGISAGASQRINRTT
jgi:hypothetical protein